MDNNIRISGFWRRSFSQRYHSFGCDFQSVGRPFMAGCFLSSTRKMADVGRQVLLTYWPEPRKVLWYQSQLAGTSDGVKANAEKWKPIQPPPFSIYFWKAARCAGSSGR